MNLMITPFDNLVLVPAFRFEYDGSDLSDNFSDNDVHANGGAVTPIRT